MEDTYLLTMRCPVYRRRDSHSGSRTELETLIGDVKGKRTSGDPTRPKVPMRRSGSDRPILVMKWGNAHGAKGAGHSRRDRWVNRKLEEPTVSTEDGSLQWVARAGYVERPKSGSVRGSGCNSPDLLGITLADLSAGEVAAFLGHAEHDRGCTICRLAAIRSFFNFVATKLKLN